MDLRAPELYLNRELSWLEFNERVLQEGLSESLPLLERLKFLAIVSSNLDEFFMIRVAGLRQQAASKKRRRDASGLTPGKQLERIADRVRSLVASQAVGVRRALQKLGDHGFHVHESRDWNPRQRRFLRDHFLAQLLPVLSPLAVQDLEPPPALPARQLHVAVLLTRKRRGKAEERVAVVPVPGQLARFFTFPAEEGVHLARVEDVVAEHAGQAFPGCRVMATAVFRLTRDADVALDDDDAEDLLQAVEKAVIARRRRAVVRLELSAEPDPRLKAFLLSWLKLGPGDVYEVDGMLDTTGLWELVNRRGFDNLRAPDWPPVTPRDLSGAEDPWSAVRERDLLLVHPYESFEPVVRLLEAAADDPNVLAIKQTLYRTSGNSPIVRALERAAGSGKQVTVLVELKARFDETRNVGWARRLEEAGCHVLYGIAGLKTHAKALLVVRREAAGIRRYVHLSTGNYNDKTATLYSDVGLLSADRELAADVASFFNLLTGYSEEVRWEALTVAPTGLRRRLKELVEREAQLATAERPGLIVAKLNSLQDRETIAALYAASRAGVRIRLNVRGICCLRPGVPGVSENIEVRSIVDRYLEHARLFWFGNGGHDELFISSADWMGRNLDQRVELLVPVRSPELRKRLQDQLTVYLADNQKAHRLRQDGTWERVRSEGNPVRAQETLYRQSADAARALSTGQVRFRPLARPRA